jgi:hypothetical protein
MRCLAVKDRRDFLATFDDGRGTAYGYCVCLRVQSTTALALVVRPEHEAREGDFDLVFGGRVRHRVRAGEAGYFGVGQVCSGR